MKKRTVAIVAVAIFVACSSPVLKVYAWGWDTHRSIVDNASCVFSSGSFFSLNITTIKDYSIKPDQWKQTSNPNYDPNEEYRHYYHVDHPHTRDQYWEGVLPWTVEDNFTTLVQRFAVEDWQGAAQLAGVIGHYIADASMPLHATSDYWLGGMHTTYESEVNGRLGEISIPKETYVPQEIENIFNATMAMLEESYEFTGNTENDLSYWLRQGTSWNSTIRDITENRLRSAVQLTANVWYTAMIRAGLTIPAPVLLQPENNAFVTSAPTLTWTSVYGTSVYDLQLASDVNFTTAVTTVKGLAENSHGLENSLAGGTWYWRVRSGDNSTNVGLWSQTRQFTISAGKALFSLATLSKVGLDIDLYLDEGSKLVMKFYKYDSATLQAENVIENITPPENIKENENIPHPRAAEGYPWGTVQIATLVLTTDDENEVISTIASFTVHQSHLRDRDKDILRDWGGHPELWDAFRAEVKDILKQWGSAPP